MSESDEKWISDLLSKLAIDVPEKSRQFKANRKRAQERKQKSR